MTTPSISSDRRECQFDFDLGYLVKSPCRDCDQRKSAFPTCSQDCLLLAQVQTALSASVSCNKKN
ncbi:MAG: hypothetical protein WAK95_00405 [Desulfobacterales bacterium]